MSVISCHFPIFGVSSWVVSLSLADELPMLADWSPFIYSTHRSDPHFYRTMMIRSTHPTEKNTTLSINLITIWYFTHSKMRQRRRQGAWWPWRACLSPSPWVVSAQDPGRPGHSPAWGARLSPDPEGFLPLSPNDLEWRCLENLPLGIFHNWLIV